MRQQRAHVLYTTPSGHEFGVIKLKTGIPKKTEEEIIREYPIKGLLEGWYFSQKEISPGGYVVSGTDLWGRQVSRNGGNPENLLNQCIADAKEILNQINTGN